MSAIAAIFDVDRTLIAIPTERLFFAYLLWRRQISPSRALAFCKDLVLHPRQRYQNKSYLRGLPASRVEELARDCFRQLIQPRLSPSGRACLRHHRQLGHQIVLLTGSLECLMWPLKCEVEADWLIAARLETTGECCTGYLRGLHPRGENKLRLLQELARKADFDLSQSYAYADHISDLPLLQHVGRPVAVNPSFRLKATAKENSWRICRF